MSNQKRPNRKDAANARKERAAEIMKAQQARSRRITIAIGAVVTVIVLVLGFLVYSGISKNNTVKREKAGALAKSLATIPTATYDAVGKGAGTKVPYAIKGASLTENGKPVVLFIGADYCPYCAAERWSMVAALSRFGTFSNLQKTTSSSTDVFPDTATLSFHGTDYTSDKVVFRAYETQDRDGQPLDTPSAEDEALLRKWDAPPYVSAKEAGSIPFIYIGGKYLSIGATYSPQILANKTQSQIAKAMQDPSTDIAKAVDGMANVWTAAICDLNGGKPANVCTSSGVTTAAAALAKAPTK